MRPLPDGVELELAEGDMTPGRLRLRALPEGAGAILLTSRGRSTWVGPTG